MREHFLDELVSAAIIFEICIWEVLGQDIDCSEVSHHFPQSLHANVEILPQSAYDHFLLNPFQFTR
jgi:hypothetical protein